MKRANTMSTITVELTIKVKTKFIPSNAEKTNGFISPQMSNFHTKLLRSMSNKVRSSHDSFVHFCDDSAGKAKKAKQTYGKWFDFPCYYTNSNPHDVLRAIKVLKEDEKYIVVPFLGPSGGTVVPFLGPSGGTKNETAKSQNPQQRPTSATNKKLKLRLFKQPAYIVGTEEGRTCEA